MSDKTAKDIENEVSDWWKTSIIDMEPGKIHYSGYPIQDLIGNISFAGMIWLMTRGELPSKGQAALLEAALVAAVDHGPQAPSIAIARMAATCGIGLNNAMASAVNVLGDVHGGAGEQQLPFITILPYAWIGAKTSLMRPLPGWITRLPNMVSISRVSGIASTRLIQGHQDYCHLLLKQQVMASYLAGLAKLPARSRKPFWSGRANASR